MEGHVKCFDAEMNPVHEDVPLDEVERGLHQGCGNIVLVWQDAEDSLQRKACGEHGVCYMFTFSDSPDGPRRYAQSYTPVA